MTSSSPSLCQQLQCDAFQFTICRHCQLFLCIKHLAEHQQQFPTDFQRLLDDARRQQAQLSTFDTRISEQRLKLNQTHDIDTTQTRQINTFLQSRTIQDGNRSCLSQFQAATFIFTDSSDMFNKLSRFPVTNIKQDQNMKKIDADDGISETDVNQTHNSLTVRELKTYKCDYCPLSTNTYGIESHHQVRYIPCIRRSTSQISLFEHLKQYHYLNYAASMQIVRLVSSGDLDDHPTLFSSASQSSIVSILPSFFRAPCPLTQHNVFGLGPVHGIRLCSPAAEQQDFALYDHFLAYHQLNRASAMKLVKAMMKNENSSQRILFRPDEQVLNQTAYVTCPLSSYDAILPHQERIPHTPCQSTVKLRYLTGHLRDVHHLNKIAAKRIASALRHEQANNNERSIGLFERDENIFKAKKKKNATRFRPPTQLAKHVQPNTNHQEQPPPPLW
ncbi:unnamed protein product [Rotaria socialis]|uniref:Uncharacterized protein n=1 Tax=Rotaria socialis TaxID=392032 RepID=A0A820Z9E3_9BILA|nr:unnamed protein product [Rotaria socialis]